MRTLGFLFLLAAGFGAAMYFGGFMDGEVEVNMTPKGRDTVNSGLKSAQEGLNSGLESLKVKSAPQVPAHK